MRCRTLIAAVAGLLLSLGPASAEAPDALDVKRTFTLTQRGFRTLQTGNVNRAESLYRRALEIIPAFPDANLGLGHIAMGERRFEDALRRYAAARDGYVAMGDALFDLRVERYEDAENQIQQNREKIAALQSVISRRTASDPYRNNPGLARIRGEIMETEQLIQRLSMIEPPVGDETEIPGEVHFYIGNALQNVGRPAAAIAAWRECAERSPGFALVHHNLAVAYWQIGRLDEALGHLERAKALGFAGHPQFEGDLRRALSERDVRAAVSAR